jgi:hypothetical protein
LNWGESANGPLNATVAWVSATPGDTPGGAIAETETSALAAGSGMSYDSGAGQKIDYWIAGWVPPYSPVEVASSSFNAQSEPGAGFGVGGTPTASVTPAGGTAVGAGFGVAVAPLNIIIPYSWVDASDNTNAWDGAQCYAYIGGVPYQWHASNYQWSVSNTEDTIQQFIYSPSNSYAVGGSGGAIPGPGILTGPSVDWYWCVPTDETVETITCSFTVTPAPGYGSPFPETLTKTVYIRIPPTTCTGVGTYMYIYQPSSTSWVLAAGEQANVVNLPGITFNAVESAGAGLPGGGALQLVQLVNPSRTAKSFGGVSWWMIPSGSLVLDTQYPYPWIWGSETNSPPRADFSTYDSPSQDLEFEPIVSITFNDEFEDFLMFQPSPFSNSTPVTIKTFNWNDDASATSIVISEEWIDGIIGPVGTPGGDVFSPSNKEPSWSSVGGTGNEQWTSNR